MNDSFPFDLLKFFMASLHVNVQQQITTAGNDRYTYQSINGDQWSHFNMKEKGQLNSHS